MAGYDLCDIYTFIYETELFDMQLKSKRRRMQQKMGMNTS